jgi:hypothetical protein
MHVLILKIYASIYRKADTLAVLPRESRRGSRRQPFAPSSTLSNKIIIVPQTCAEHEKFDKGISEFKHIVVEIIVIR